MEEKRGRASSLNWSPKCNRVKEAEARKDLLLQVRGHDMGRLILIEPGGLCFGTDPEAVSNA